MDELFDLALHEPGDGDACPLGDNLGDVLVGDLVGEHGLARGVELVQLRFLLREDLLELRDLAVADLAGTLEVGLALRAVEPALGVGDIRLGGVNRLDRTLLVLPAGGEPGRALREIGELLLERSETCL